MFHLCTTAIFRTIYHKRKILDIRLNIKDFSSVGVTGFEPATTRPPDKHSLSLRPTQHISTGLSRLKNNSRFIFLPLYLLFNTVRYICTETFNIRPL